MVQGYKRVPKPVVTVRYDFLCMDISRSHLPDNDFELCQKKKTALVCLTRRNPSSYHTLLIKYLRQGAVDKGCSPAGNKARNEIIRNLEIAHQSSVLHKSKTKN